MNKFSIVISFIMAILYFITWNESTPNWIVGVGWLALGFSNMTIQTYKNKNI